MATTTDSLVVDSVARSMFLKLVPHFTTFTGIPHTFDNVHTHYNKYTGLRAGA